MIASAIHSAFDEIADRFDQRLRQNGAAAAIEAYVEEYLSDRHIEHPGYGCPVAAVAADAARHRGVFAEEFVEGAERLIQRLSGGFGGEPRPSPARTKALRRLAMLVGAVVIARATGRSRLREEIIAACVS